MTNTKQHRLVLTWKPGLHTRKEPIGELWTENDKYKFKYTINQQKFEELKKEGFNFYPAFQELNKIYNGPVLKIFSSRLPKRNRSDFKKTLEYWDIEDENISDFDIIRITGAKLPTDGFEFIDTFEGLTPPFEALLDIAGLHYYLNNIPQNLQVKDKLYLKHEPNNGYDKDALRVLTFENQHIGYIPKIQATSLLNLINEGNSIELFVNKITELAGNKYIQLKLFVK